MTRDKSINPELFDRQSRTLVRVMKPKVKLVACPARAWENHGWRIQLFLGDDEHPYERRTCTVNHGNKRAERWFIVTNIEVQRTSPEERERAAQEATDSAAEYRAKRPNKRTRAAEEKNWGETECIYSVGVLFFDLLGELDFAIDAQFFDEDRQRILRRVQKRLFDARQLCYQLNAPAPVAIEPRRRREPLESSAATGITRIQ